MRTGISVTVSPADCRRLEALVRDRTTPQKHAWRGGIVLLTAAGPGTVEIMRRTGKSKTWVWRWQERFAAEGVEGLLRDNPRPSRIPPLGPEVVERGVALTLTDPPGETTRWTADRMAAAVGISASSIRRIRRAHGLPLRKGRAGTITHDDKRHGTTTLFAALNVLDGSVIGRTMQRHRHQEFIRFLNTIDKSVAPDTLVHVILGAEGDAQRHNDAAHKHAKLRRWLDRHPRFIFHFVPSSWLNAVEGVFAKPTKRRLKRGVFHSVVDLQSAINRFLAEHDARPKPFIRTAKPDSIIAAVRRRHPVLDSIR
jgi:transposase